MATTSRQNISRNRGKSRSEIVINDLSKCYYCKSTGLTENDKFCPNCGFPQRGTQVVMKKFIWTINNKNKLLDEQKKAVNKAKNILFILAGLNLTFGLLLGIIIQENIGVLIAGVITAVIFFALGQWSKKNPFPAILSGLFVYIALNVINAISDPHTIYQGLILKIIIISGFIYGYKGVKDSKKLEEELDIIKKAKDLKIEENTNGLSEL